MHVLQPFASKYVRFGRTVNTNMFNRPLRNRYLHLQTTPGGLNAGLDNAFASEVEAALIPALRPDAALRATGFILRPPTPQKLHSVLMQLAAEPREIGKVEMRS